MPPFEIFLTPEEQLFFANNANDAGKSLYRQALGRPLTVESCRGLTPAEVLSLQTTIDADKTKITAANRPKLLGLLDECKKSATITPTTASAAASAPAKAVQPPDANSLESFKVLPESLKQAQEKAIAAMNTKLGNPGSTGAKEYMGGWEKFASKIPGYEPTDYSDASDITYQPREFAIRFIGALAYEASQNTDFLPIGLNSKMPGYFPALQKNHDFKKDGWTVGNQRIYGVEAKRQYILDTLTAITNAYNSVDSTKPKEAVDFTAELAIWALPIFGSAIIVMSGGRMLYNMGHDGLRKPNILGSAGWSVGKIWDGTKWIFNGSKTGITVGGRSLVAGGMRQTVARTVAGGIAGGAALGTLTGGPIGTAVGAVSGGIAGYRFRGGETVKPADLKDTAAYTADDWAKERARLAEATRRMIYMDSGKNPRHNPNATAAEIFRDVEGTPALKTAFDARMVKLTELGNTLVGQEKFLSKEAFDKEAGRIVAGDIEKPTIATKVKKSIPFTAERKEYKETQAALKKVKGEIAAMRARLQAKATMDGVEIPKALEDQFRAFETAYKAAYEADQSLDRSRSLIARTADRINAINEVIAKFDEIEKLKTQIGDASGGIIKDIAALQAKIAAATPAAHTESIADARAREAEGKQGEIDAAKSARETALRASDQHEAAKKEAQRDKRAADLAVAEEEARMRREIVDIRNQLASRIAEYPAKIAAASDKSPKAILESERDALELELNKYPAKIAAATDPILIKALENERDGVKANFDKYPAKIAAASSISPQDALNTERLRLEDEFNGKTGRIKELADQLTPPHTGSPLAAKKQAAQDAQDAFNDLINKDAAKLRAISDAEGEISRLAGEKAAILSRTGGPNATTLLTTDQARLDRLNTEKTAKEEKIKAIKGEIDVISGKPENKGFPRSTGGTLALANAELGRLEALIVPGGTLDTAKTTAKVARDTAFIHLNTTIVTLNTESARLNTGLEIPVPHIAEMVKGQGFSEELSMRESGTTGDKAADHKLKGTRPASVKTVMTGGRKAP